MTYTRGPDLGAPPVGRGKRVRPAEPGGPYEGRACRGQDHVLEVVRELSRDVLTCRRCSATWARMTAKVDANRNLIRTPNASYVVLQGPATDRRLAEVAAARNAALRGAAERLGATIVNAPAARRTRSAESAEGTAP